jgi:NADH-quinone oxidoreductase subunit B
MEPAIVTPRQSVVAAPSGELGDSEDALVANVNNELSDKGFLVATADNLIAWARTGSGGLHGDMAWRRA